MEERQLFSRLAGLAADEEPYCHQRKCLRFIADGDAVLVHAPTGSGKSEAVFVPFLLYRDKAAIPSRLIHVLPMRALAESLHDRFHKIAQEAIREKVVDPSFRVAVQHGLRPESVLFYADAIVATLDQVASSYVCAPLSLGVRHGNIPAGAVASSFLVFDEIHTFDWERGLQSLLFFGGTGKKSRCPSGYYDCDTATYRSYHSLREA